MFPGGKGGRCLRLSTLPSSCAVVMKSGNLNFLEPSRSVQACNGTALPFFTVFKTMHADCGFCHDVTRSGAAVNYPFLLNSTFDFLCLELIVLVLLVKILIFS